LGSFQLTGVAEPTLAQDAATKNYVDTSASKLLLLLQNSGLYGTSYRFYYRFQYNAGGFEVTLPAAADNTGKVYVISKRDDGSNNLSLPQTRLYCKW
jgi:hypothetical protein